VSKLQKPSSRVIWSIIRPWPKPGRPIEEQREGDEIRQG
jgi:hypothetical protein